MYWIRNIYNLIKLIFSRQEVSWHRLSKNIYVECNISKEAKISSPCSMGYVDIEKFTYIASNATISYTKIGKFCSIGPNLISGWGIHPIYSLSTSPVFYSKNNQSTLSYSKRNKIEERKQITIGNDVFIGANVTILDGVTIHDGAVIGAGAVVSKDIPPYAIAVGVPIKIIKYRFSESVIASLLKIKWWDGDENTLKDVESHFDEIEKFIENKEIYQ